jgi:hypothetical protein
VNLHFDHREISRRRCFLDRGRALGAVSEDDGDARCVLHDVAGRYHETSWVDDDACPAELPRGGGGLDPYN